jgi:UDP-N-acetylmuramoyl-tripeptide--D-alanyl-D-alanine ligase
LRQLFTVGEIAAATGGRILSGDLLTPVFGFAYDSRKVAAGDCFVAMPGDRFDGHQFVAGAFAAGAVAALVGRAVEAEGGALIRVEDSLLALGVLGNAHRRRFSLPVVGVTGSVGKTTTKEMIAAALSPALRVFRSTGNLNSEVGLPVTLMALDESHEAAVLEMGMRGLGEIAYLASIAGQTIGVVTNVGTSHLELLGTRENIALAKSELVRTLPPGGVAVLNWDDERVRAMAAVAPGPVWYYGFGAAESGSERVVTVRNLRRDGDAGQRFTLQTPAGAQEVSLPAPGRHLVQNAMAAAAVAIHLGIRPAQVAAGLASYEPAGSRMRVITRQGVRIIDDTYNAAPDSTVAALRVMRELAGQGRCIAVLASMFELGEAAAEGHRLVGVEAARQADVVIAVGDLAEGIARGARDAGGARVHHVSAKDGAAALLTGTVRSGDTVLVKGSRGMAMEEIVAHLENTLPRFA